MFRGTSCRSVLQAEMNHSGSAGGSLYWRLNISMTSLSLFVSQLKAIKTCQRCISRAKHVAEDYMPASEAAL